MIPTGAFILSLIAVGVMAYFIILFARENEKLRKDLATPKEFNEESFAAELLPSAAASISVPSVCGKTRNLHFVRDIQPRAMEEYDGLATEYQCRHCLKTVILTAEQLRIVEKRVFTVKGYPQ